jgi:hypothetical protein
MQPGCIPSPMVIQDDDHQFGGGEKQAGLRPLPRPQLQGSSSSLLGRRAGQVGACLRVGRRPASSSGIRGRKASSSSAEEASSSHAGKANCCFLDRVQLSVLHPGDGRAARGPATSRSSLRCRLPNTSYAARAVLVFWDGPVLVLVARTGVRTCRCALGQPPLAGAVLVGRWPLSSVLRWWSPEEVASAEAVAPVDETVSATCAPGLWLFGFNGWFSSPVRGRERGPSSGSVCPGAIAAAVLPSETEVVVALLVQRSSASHLKFVVPQALWCGGSSYPRE